MGEADTESGHTMLEKRQHMSVGHQGKMEMNRQGISKIRVLVLAGLLALALGMTAQAADGWVRNNNKISYLAGNNRVTGLAAIGGRTYYFDAAGVQRVSWRQIGNDYYCFRSEEMDGGYMMTNTAWNGIWLGPDGRAQLTTDRAVRKVTDMVRVSALMDRIIDSSKERLPRRINKMKACYDYLRKHYPYRYVGHFREKDPDNDLFSLEALLNRGYADCHPYACTFAYLASALGCSNVTIQTWYTYKYGHVGHSWVVIGDKVFDVSLGRHNKKSYALFGMKTKTFHRKYPYYHINARKNLWEL